MKFTLPLAAAALAFALTAHGTTFASQSLPETVEPAPQTPAEPSETPAPPAAPQPAQEAPAKEAPAAIEVPPVTPVAAEEPEEEKRICRRIRTDMSSRRATRVCMTRDEWREFNQSS